MNSTLHHFEFSGNNELDITPEEIVFKNGWGKHHIKHPVGIKFGVKSIDVYHLRLGYEYLIKILTNEGETISIPFRAILGIGRNQIFERYNAVIDALWECHFDSLYQELVESYNGEEDLNFENKYILTGDGLEVVSTRRFISFQEMQLTDTAEYFCVSSRADPKLYTNVYYLKTWNASMLYSMLDSIISQV